METNRRNILKSLAVLPIVGAPAAALFRSAEAQAAQLRFVADQRMPGGAALVSTAKAQGLPWVDPQGEIVMRFLGAQATWLSTPGSIIGLTNYSDMMLMSDLARQSGRSLRYAAARGQAGVLVDRLEAGELTLVTALRDTPVPHRQASAFVWMV